jgi:hypothetical protein
MVFQSLDLTTALRPEFAPEETLLFVQDAVGLYEGYPLSLPFYRSRADESGNTKSPNIKMAMSILLLIESAM